MRMIIGTLALTALVGCAAQDEVALEHRSVLETQARGIALDGTGAIANVGMSNTTCDIETSVAGVQADYDYTSDAEVVVDGTELDNIGVINLVLTPDTVHVNTPDSPQADPSHPAAGAIDASVIQGGYVVVNDSGDVTWSTIEGNVNSEVEAGLDVDGGSSLTTDPSSGTAFVATADGVVAVTSSGETFQVTDGVDALVAWDTAADALYVAQPGSTEVQAFEADGTLRWSSQVEGTVAALTEMGAKGNVALSVETGAGGSFVVLDGASGMRTAALSTPSAAQALEVSGSGDVLAVELASAVHFFDITAQ